LNNAKYGSKSILPELRVIDSGLLRGYVTVNPRWAGFKAPDYFQAAASLSPSNGENDTGGFIEAEPEIHVTVEAGDFDMRGFEIARSEFFDSHRRPYVTFQDKQIKFSTDCVRKLGKNNMVEFLVNPREMMFAVRTAAKDSRHSVPCSRVSNGIYYPKTISCAAYMDTLFQIFGWNSDYKYRISGTLFQKENEAVYLFNMSDAEVFIKPYLIAGSAEADSPEDDVKPLSVSGTRVRAVPQEWMSSFGNQYYLHQHIFPPVESQSENDWKIRLEGQLYDAGEKINVTGFDELKSFITQELSRGEMEENANG